MAGRDSLAVLDVGNVRMRGTLKSVDNGGIKRNHEANADGSVDYSEEITIGKIVIELSVVSDTDEDAIKALKNQVGLLTYRTNGKKRRFPNLSFAEQGEKGPDGKCDYTFCGDPSVKA